MPDDAPAATVRRADKSDQRRVGDLWVAFLEEQAERDPRFQLADDARARFDNDFRVWLEDGTQRTFVAERAADGGNAEVVGFATAHRWGPPPIYAEASEVFVDEFYVAPGARGRGTGRRLAEALRTWAAEVEASRLRLRVLSANDGGRAFWERIGGAAFSATMTIELEGEAHAKDEKDETTRGRLGF